MGKLAVGRPGPWGAGSQEVQGVRKKAVVLRQGRGPMQGAVSMVSLACGVSVGWRARDWHTWG